MDRPVMDSSEEKVSSPTATGHTRKAPYSAPTLTIHGPVRNLTENMGTGGGDATLAGGLSTT